MMEHYSTRSVNFNPLIASQRYHWILYLSIYVLLSIIIIFLDLMLFRSWYQNKLVYRPFHTSSPRHINPVIWVFLKPALKGVAWLTGRSARKWYRQLPPEKRSIFVQHLNRNKFRYIGIFGTIGTAFAIHYYLHLETVPITGRRRYMMMNAEKLQSFFEMTRDTHAKDYHHQLLSEESKETQLVARVAKQILASNMDIPSISTIKWCVRVIDSDVKNAFVLPSGDIYFYRGWLKIIKNEDQLAVTVGHELAHAILGHSAEEMSYSRIVDILAILGAFVIWSIFPSDWASLCVNYIFEKFITYSARLPYSRRLKEEADAVGLMLAAKACYDVRESVDFWQTQHVTEGNNEMSKYRSTHPSNAKRVENLKEILPWSLDIRLQCKCDPLSEKKPLGVQNPFIDETKKKMNAYSKRMSGFSPHPVIETAE